MTEETKTAIAGDETTTPTTGEKIAAEVEQNMGDKAKVEEPAAGDKPNPETKPKDDPKVQAEKQDAAKAKADAKVEKTIVKPKVETTEAPKSKTVAFGKAVEALRKGIDEASTNTADQKPVVTRPSLPGIGLVCTLSFDERPVFHTVDSRGNLWVYEITGEDILATDWVIL